MALVALLGIPLAFMTRSFRPGGAGEWRSLVAVCHQIVQRNFKLLLLLAFQPLLGELHQHIGLQVHQLSGLQRMKVRGCEGVGDNGDADDPSLGRLWLEAGYR